MLIFRDTTNLNKLNELGYIVLDLLDNHQLESLKQLYSQINWNNRPSGAKLNVSSRDCAFEDSLRISQSINEIIRSSVDKLFQKYHLFGGAFIVKTPHSEATFNLHQDYTLVNPEKDILYSMWIPLQDTSVQNGAVFIAEKSHRLFRNYISASYNNDTIKRSDIESRFIKDIEMKAGQVLIFLDSVFHGSSPNQTDNSRMAVTAKIAPEGTDMKYYERVDDYNAVEYKIEPNDLIKHFDDLILRNIPETFVLWRNIYYRHNNINAQKLNIALKKINGEKLSLLEKFQDIF